MDYEKLSKQVQQGKTFSTIIPSMNIEVYGKPYTLDDEITVSGLMELEDPSMFYAGIANLLMEKYSLSTETMKKLTSIDLMWLVTQLKKNSDGDVIKITFKCPHCETKLNAEINLNEIKIKNPDNFTKICEISDTMKIEMGVPYFNDYYNIIKDFQKGDEENISKMTIKNIDMFKYSIKKIYNGDKINEITDKERYSEGFDSFIKKDLRKQYREFIIWLEKEAPEIDYSKKILCANKECKKNIVLDISDFFYSML